MNIKKVLRTVVVPIVSGAVAAGVAILLSRPKDKVTIDPDYDVPTDVDEPPFLVEEKPGIFTYSEETKPTIIPTQKSRKPKTV